MIVLLAGGAEGSQARDLPVPAAGSDRGVSALAGGAGGPAAVACDFATGDTVLLRKFYLLFFIDVDSRTMYFDGITEHPTDARGHPSGARRRTSTITSAMWCPVRCNA